MTQQIILGAVWFMFFLLTYGFSYGFFAGNFPYLEQQKGIHLKLLAIASGGPFSFVAYLFSFGFEGFRYGIKFW